MPTYRVERIVSRREIILVEAKSAKAARQCAKQAKHVVLDPSHHHWKPREYCSKTKVLKRLTGATAFLRHDDIQKKPDNEYKGYYPYYIIFTANDVAPVFDDCANNWEIRRRLIDAGVFWFGAAESELTDDGVVVFFHTKQSARNFVRYLNEYVQKRLTELQQVQEASSSGAEADHDN